MGLPCTRQRNHHCSDLSSRLVLPASSLGLLSLSLDFPVTFCVQAVERLCLWIGEWGERARVRATASSVYLKAVLGCIKASFMAAGRRFGGRGRPKKYISTRGGDPTSNLLADWILSGAHMKQEFSSYLTGFTRRSYLLDEDGAQWTDTAGTPLGIRRIDRTHSLTDQICLVDIPHRPNW